MLRSFSLFACRTSAFTRKMFSPSVVTILNLATRMVRPPALCFAASRSLLASRRCLDFFASGAPLYDGWGRIFTIEGHPLDIKNMTFINHIVVTPGYFRTLAIPLLQGRDFTDDDFDAPRIVIVSGTTPSPKRIGPARAPFGKRLRFGPPKNNEPWHTVVGVVADISKHGKYKGEDRASVYLPLQRGNYSC